MPEKGTFSGPLSGTIQAGFSAGRVEIITFDTSRKCQKLGFCREAIYLKACFEESEIGDVKNRQVLDFWIFRRPYPTILTETARNY